MDKVLSTEEGDEKENGQNGQSQNKQIQSAQKQKSGLTYQPLHLDSIEDGEHQEGILIRFKEPYASEYFANIIDIHIVKISFFPCSDNVDLYKVLVTERIKSLTDIKDGTSDFGLKQETLNSYPNPDYTVCNLCRQ